MRRFSSQERKVLTIINNSNGLNFQTLLMEKIIDCNIRVSRKLNKVEMFFLTKEFTPTQEELSKIEVINNELFERIFLAVSLVHYFKNEGLISLYQKSVIPEETIIGTTPTTGLGLYTFLPDEFIKNLLLEYTDKMLLITTEFKNLARNNFISREEKRQIRANNLAWSGITIAIITSLVGFWYSYLQYKSNDLNDINDNLKKEQVIQEDIKILLQEMNINETKEKIQSDSMIIKQIVKEILENKASH
jgi:hypothetical protein